MIAQLFKSKVVVTGLYFAAACLLFAACSSTSVINQSEEALTEVSDVVADPSNFSEDTEYTQQEEVNDTKEEYDLSELPYLAAIPERDIYLKPGEIDGVVLSIGEHKFNYDWQYITPRLILPVMQASDFDDDEEDELAIILYNGSGTGVAIEELHIVEIAEQLDLREIQLTDYVFSKESYLDQLRAMGTFKPFLNDAGELHGELTIGSTVYPVDLQEYQSEEYGAIHDTLLWGNIVHFASDNNTLTAEFGIGLASEHAATPLYIGLLSADVEYVEGEFLLRNARFVEE